MPLSSAGGAAGGAAAAAAAIARMKRQEEEEMTPYGPGDLSEYEFKIIRSTTGAFGKPERLKEILAEEGQAGWELVEKFDTQRVRLKRQVAWRDKDATLGWDPYRTTIGLSEGKLVGVILLIVFGSLFAVAGLIAVLVKQG
jgi:hypothetical protein